MRWFLFFFAVLARAASFPVTDCGDNAVPGDLRSQITAANTFSGPGNSITFVCSGTVTLNSPLPFITSNLSIDGGTLGNIIIDGRSLYRGFFVDTGTVILANLQIQNVKAQGGNGGNGIGAGGGGAGFGGGLFVNQASATVSVESVLFQNVSVAGGNGGNGIVGSPGAGGSGAGGFGNGGAGGANGDFGGGGGSTLNAGRTSATAVGGVQGGTAGAGNGTIPGGGGGGGAAGPAVFVRLGTLNVLNSSANGAIQASSGTGGTGNSNGSAGTISVAPVFNFSGTVNGTMPHNILPATHFSVTAPANLAQGANGVVTVKALDSTNTVTAAYNGTVNLSSSDPAFVNLTGGATLTNGIGTFSVNLSNGGVQTITTTDSILTNITGVSNNITVAAGAAVSLAVSAPATVAIGVPFNFTVTARDSLGNTATSYAGRVHFTSTDTHAVLPANSTLTAGARTLTATLSTRGTQTITGGDTTLTALAGTSSIQVLGLPPVATLDFNPSVVGQGLPSTLTLTVTNPNAFPLTGLNFANNYPAGLITDRIITSTCGSTLAASCQLVAIVHSPTMGMFIDSTNAITSNEAQPGASASATLTVGEVTQAIAFRQPPNPTWGDPPFVLLASSTSGMAINFTVSSTSMCSVDPLGTVTILGAGPCQITADQPGNTVYTEATAMISFTINPAPLKISADNQIMIQGNPLPLFTATITGLVNGDSVGLPALTTTATSVSPPGNYPITASAGSLSSPNYTFSFKPGTLTITAPVPPGLVNSWSFGTGFIAPNTLMTYFGPACDTPAVSIDGRPMQVLFANSSQINFATDYYLANEAAAKLEINCAGALTDFSVPTATVNPALLPVILNQDGTVNSLANPAFVGTTISLYTTGLGPYNPWITDNFMHPLNPVSASIGGAPVNILYAGNAPDLLLAVQQVNVQLPVAVSNASLPIVLTINGVNTAAGTTVAVKLLP